MNLYVVKKEPKIVSERIEKSIFEENILAKERRIEDLQIQNLFYKCMLHQYKNIHERSEFLSKKNYELCKEIGALNVFSRRVILNTLGRVKKKLYNILRLNPK